jgi:hypothetical protein
MLRHVAPIRTDISEKRMASIIRVTIIGELGTKIAVTSNRSALLRSLLQLLVTANVPNSPIVTLMMEAISFSETLVLTRATWRNSPEDGILPITRNYCKSLGYLFGYFTVTENLG